MNTALEILTGFAQLAGFAALTSAVVNALKVLGIVKDGTANVWFAGLSLLEIAFLVIMAYVRPDLSVEFFDKQAGAVAVIISILMGYITQLAAGLGAHKIFSAFRIPIIGTSFSRRT